jgi:hypothetical protein
MVVNSKPKRRLMNATLVLLGLAVALLFMEGVVRLFFSEPIVPRFVVDSGFGVRANQPDVVTRHSVPGVYDVQVTTNHAGMRGKREYAIRQPAGVIRVALEGDSFIFGHGVNDEDVVSVILEDALNAEGQGKWEVLNFGVSGFGQSEELVTYENLIRGYSPHAVVLFYFDNDIGNNAVSGLYRLGPDGRLERAGREYLPGVGASEALHSFGPTRWLLVHSRASNLIRNRLSALVHNTLLKQRGLRDYSTSTPKSAALTRALILEHIRILRKDGLIPIIFVIPNPSLQSNFPFTKDEIARSGALYVDGRSFLDRGDYHHKDLHWNSSGHKKAAMALAKELRTQLRAGGTTSISRSGEISASRP